MQAAGVVRQQGLVLLEHLPGALLDAVAVDPGEPVELVELPMIAAHEWQVGVIDETFQIGRAEVPMRVAPLKKSRTAASETSSKGGFPNAAS